MFPDPMMMLLLYFSHRELRATHSWFSTEVVTTLEGVVAAIELAAVPSHNRSGDAFILPPTDVQSDERSW